MKIRTLLLAFAVVASLASVRLIAAEKTAAEILPASTVGYLEISDPKQLIGVILDHPLRKRVEDLAEYKKALDSKEGQQLRTGIVFAEFQLGMELRPALEKLTGGGIYLAGDPKSNGIALLVKSSDAALLEKLLDTALKLARDAAANQGGGDPIKSVEYRGVKAYQAGEARFAIIGSWLVATNKDELGKQMFDNYLDGGASLAADAQFQAARKNISGKPTAWGYLSLAPLRNAGVAKELYKEKSDNPALEVLFGGLLSNLKQTPFATVSLYVETEQVRLVAQTPHDPSWVAKPREFYFGPGNKGAAPEPLTPKQTILSIGTYRDFAGLWLSKSDLFDENVIAGFAQADNTLSTLLQGRDFGRDILGAFRPEMQLVVARQDYKGLETPEPDIKLPAGALIVQFKEAEKMQPQLKLLFKSLVGFINVASAQQGQPPLDFNDEKHGDGSMVVTKYLADKSTDGKINYNLSPTIGFVKDRFIISSTSNLAGELIDLAAAAKPTAVAENQPRDNTRATISVAPLRAVLEDNRKHLVAQNQLEKGHSKEAAENEIGGLLAILSAVKDATLRLGGDGKSLSFELGLRLEPAK